MELPDVGAQCDAQDCRQLDFLPFICIGCGKTFCLHHRGLEGHSCDSKAGQLNHSTKDEQCKMLQDFHPCSNEACEQTVPSLIGCPRCGKGFCIIHRHPEDHSCPEIQTQVQHKTVIKQQPASIAQPKGRVGRKSSETARRVKIMKMKMKAEGNQTVPQDHRMYFHVKCADFKGGTESPVFFSKHSTIGFIVDDLAKTMKLINPNNRTTGKRLCLLDADGVHLPSHVKIEDLTGSEGSLQEGQTLSLQYTDR